MAERVQAIRIRLSDGSVGLFWGAPIAEWPHAPGLAVVDVEFEAPRYVSGITLTPIEEIPRGVPPEAAERGG